MKNILLFIISGLFTVSSFAQTVTWYTYQAGDWNDANIWTLNGSGATRDNDFDLIPSAVDNVVILNGRTVTMIDDNINVASITIEGSGILDLVATSGHNFNNVSGDGTLRLSGAAGVDNFPAGNAADFADDFIGGTVVYYGTGVTLDQNRIFNNLILNLTSTTDELVLVSDLTINGDLTLTRGAFQINDDSETTIRNLEVLGDVFVNANAAMSVGEGNTIGTFSITGNLPSTGNYHNIFHQVIFNGNLINQGSMRFTNQAAPDYSQLTNTGAATVRFKGAVNNTVDLFGTTDFYNLVIDKGSDRTYELLISSSTTANFALYGPNNLNSRANGGFTDANREVRKALFIYNGTLRLTGFIEIPSLSEGGEDYIIGGNGALWIDGADVTVYSTAIDISENPTVNTGSGSQALTLYGGFRITNGFFGTRNSAGFIFRDGSAGEVLIEGGTVNVSQFRSSGTTTAGGTYTYTQSGGSVLVRASEDPDGGETSGTYALFSLETSDAVFNMSGGELMVYAGLRKTLFINSVVGNYNVTGGTVIVENRNNNNGNGVNGRITSTVPFWDLVVGKGETTGGNQIELITSTSGSGTIVNPDLKVLNNFTIRSGVTFNHNGNDVEIGRNFNIEAGADYEYNVGKPNTTTINGTDDATLSFLNRTGGAGNEQRFWNLVINKPTGRTVRLASGKTDLTGNENNLINIEGDAFKVLSGTLDQGFHSIRVYSDTLVNYDVLTVYNPANYENDVAANGDNDILKFRDDGGVPTILLTTDNAKFGAVKLNSGAEIIRLNSDIKIDYLHFRYGRIDLQTYNLKVDFLDTDFNNGQADWNNCNGCYSVEDMFITAGNVSDGGLSLYIPSDGLDPEDGDNTFLFPIGVGTDGIDADTDGGNSKYSPARIQLSNVTDDGYITIKPVDGILPTTDGNGGTMLSYYWRVEYEGFSSIPDVVSLIFTGYEDDDASNPTNTTYPTSWQPGKVLSTVPYSRSTEDKSNIDSPSGHDIMFNGFLESGPVTNGSPTPFTLENADYSAGPPNRFNGSPGIYYTRGQDLTNIEPLWSTAATWTRSDLNDFDPTNPHSSDNPASTDVPGVGDIVNIGFFPFDDPQTTYRGYPHSARVNSGDAEAAVVIFTQMTDASGNAPVERKPISDLGGDNDFQFRPTLTWNSTGSILITSIQGEGTVRVRGEGTNAAQRDPDFSNIDLGIFVNQDSAYLLYEAFSDYTINNVPDVVPNLMITNDGFGANNWSVTIDKNIIVNQNLEIQGNSNLLLGTGTTGHIVIGNNLHLRPLSGGVGGGELQFANSGTGRNISVGGNVYMGNPSGAAATGGNIIRVVSGGAVTHQLSVSGDIINNTTGSNGGFGNGLKLGDGTGSVVNLRLEGATNNLYRNVSGDVAQLHRIIMNKGVTSANTFTFEDDFTLNGATNGATKALTMQNGTLILNDPAIDINLNTGGADFNIPSSAALQLTQGTARVSGDDTGITLDGSIIINGASGVLDMSGAGNGNNYIEYSASGSAAINISSGVLVVGSQIRGGIATDLDVLNYTQTGGQVVVGENAAPVADKGVFEVKNTGSNFTYTGGSLTIVRSNTAAPAVAALRIFPSSSDVRRTIVIGNSSTPANANVFGINSSIPLAGLFISSNNSPVASIQKNDLTLTGDLTISTGSTFNANARILDLEANFINNGTFTASGNTTTFSATTTQTLSGTSPTTFFNLTKLEQGTLDIADNDITVDNVFSHEAGTINDNGNVINLLGNVVIEGTHTSLAGGGLNFTGAGQQQLRRLTSDVSNVGIVTISNTNGVVIPENGYNFNINSELAMNGGVFNVGSAAITIGQNAEITTSTSFGVSNMVVTNNSFTDSGLTKIFPPGYSNRFVFPIGEIFYTPAIFDFSIAGGTSGGTLGSISAKPANEFHPVINDGSEFYADDVKNVLQYYWTLKSTGISGLFADVEFIYDESHLATDEVTEADYIAARILLFDNPSNNINKYTIDEVGEVTNTISFPAGLVFNGVGSNGIAGDYFAGDEDAIPINVATYTTQATLGDVTNTLTYVEDLPTDGVSPSGAVLVVSTGTEVTFNVDNVQLYKTVIENGATLSVDDTDGHRLGIVEGTGNLKITSSGINANLPAGDYGTFFSCTGGGLEYTGTGNYNMLIGSGTAITSLRNLVLSGSGNRILPNSLTICEDLIINGPDLVNTNNAITVNGTTTITAGNFLSGTGTITFNGNLLVNGGTYNHQAGGVTSLFGDLMINSGNFNSGTSGDIDYYGNNITLSGGLFNGGSAGSTTRFFGVLKTIDGDFTGSNSFYRLELVNQGVNKLNGDLGVSSFIRFSTGIVNMNANTFIFSSSTTYAEGSSNSYINGRAIKTLSDGAAFTFPIGSASHWRPASVNGVITDGLSLTWSAQYFQGDPAGHPLVDNLDFIDPIKAVSNGEYWVISDDAGAAPAGTVSATVGLSWGIESDVSSNIFDITDHLKVMKWNDTANGGLGNWESLGSSAFTGTSTTGSFSAGLSNTFSEQVFTLGSDDAVNPLPIELLSFTGKNIVNANLLTWVTSSEINNDYFELQRSFDGVNYEALATIDGSGNTLIEMTYAYTDRQPLLGKNYYRLKQVDFDGQFSVENDIVLIDYVPNNLPFSLIVYPNPTNEGTINLRIESDVRSLVKVSMFDLFGKKVFDKVLRASDYPNGEMKLVPSQSINQGMYIITLEQLGKKITRKLLIEK